MDKTLKTVLISAGVAAALIFGLSKCGGSGISSGLSVLDKLVKSRPDTVVRIDTVFKLVAIYKDTCLKGIKLEDFSKKVRKKINKILKKDVYEIPKLYPIDLYKPNDAIISNFLLMSNGDTLWVDPSFYKLPELIYDGTTITLPYDSGTSPVVLDDISNDTALSSPKRLYYNLPIDCYTSTESAKLQRNSTRTLNAIGGIDAKGYVYGGLMLRSSGGFGMGFFVSSGRYNGLQIQVPIKRFR